MNEILDKFYKIVESTFAVRNFMDIKNNNINAKLARRAFLWLCRNFTDLKLREIAEQTNTTAKFVFDNAKMADKLYWNNSHFCRNLAKCISKVPRYQPKPLQESSIEPLDDVVVMDEIAKRYPKKCALLLQYIYNLTEFDRITIKQKELMKYAKRLSNVQVYRAYYLLLKKGAISDTSTDFGVRSIKIIDKELIKAVEEKNKKPREKKDFRATLPESVMEHVLALQKIRENKLKNLVCKI